MYFNNVDDGLSSQETLFDLLSHDGHQYWLLRHRLLVTQGSGHLKKWRGQKVKMVWENGLNDTITTGFKFNQYQ